MQRLEGRIAVITGAASGIGRALALQLAEAGCGLALVDVQAETLRRVGAECRERGAQVSTHAVDVSDRAAMAALPQRVIDFHGAVHILINNAGVTVADTVLEQSLEDWDWIVGINLWGVIYGCRAFLPHLLAAEEAHIVNLSSVFGIAGVPMQAAYCTTKFAVLGFSESLQAELRGTCVGLSVVHPGGVNTNIVRASRLRD
jgi:NAD(P)-dependent dehydrogenase (short-subunit alcohol dehydrogenase family)